MLRCWNYLKPTKVHILFDGQVIKSGGPELALELEEKGYDKMISEGRAA